MALLTQWSSKIYEMNERSSSAQVSAVFSDQLFAELPFINGDYVKPSSQIPIRPIPDMHIA